MPNKLKTQLKENEFYCVKCRKRVKSHEDDICVKIYRNKKIKGGVPVLVSSCNKCDTNLNKFIKHDSKKEMIKYYGKC
jgi:hypothetical protein